MIRIINYISRFREIYIRYRVTTARCIQPLIYPDRARIQSQLIPQFKITGSDGLIDKATRLSVEGQLWIERDAAIVDALNEEVMCFIGDAQAIRLELSFDAWRQNPCFPGRVDPEITTRPRCLAFADVREDVGAKVAIPCGLVGEAIGIDEVERIVGGVGVEVSP